MRIGNNFSEREGITLVLGRGKRDGKYRMTSRPSILVGTFDPKKPTPYYLHTIKNARVENIKDAYLSQRRVKMK